MSRAGPTTWKRRPSQRIRYLRTRDGLDLAWAEAGTGPVLLKAANWLTHLEYDWESLVWRHWIHFFSDHFRFLRYDERGCGMSDRHVGDLSFERWVDDLEAVVAAAGLEEPFMLLGISQGAAVCVEYAVRHPERVSHLLLYGGYARGWSRRGDPGALREFQAIVELVRRGWGRDNPVFRQVFTSRFIPGGSPGQLEWFNELCRKTAAPEAAARLLESRANIDVSHLLGTGPRTNPASCTHGMTRSPRSPKGVAWLPVSPAPSSSSSSRANHVLLAHEPAWARFGEVVLDFLALPPAGGEDPAFESLSPREREVLVLVTDGLGNAQIGERLSISEKTVRNHVSNLFDKLGVWTRAQAIVFARDRGFRA